MALPIPPTCPNRLRLLPLLAACGLCLAVPWVIPGFRDPSGGLAPEAVLPFSGAVAALMFGVSRRTALARAWGWLALTAIGQGALLTLVDAPARVEYQHLRLAPWTGVRLVALGILVVQAFILARWARTDLRAVTSRLASTRARGAIISTVAIASLCSAALSRDAQRLVGELAAMTLLQMLFLVTALAAVGACLRDPQRTVERLGTRILGNSGDPGPRQADRWVAIVALGAAVVATSLSVLAYDRHPHVPDEVNYLLQARYFASGQLALPVPVVPEAFNLDLMMIRDGRWFSVFPPGWPAVLAIGAWLGAPFLVNPVLTGVVVLLTYRLVGSLYDQRTTRLSTLLMACSPWSLGLGMSFMSHQASLSLALLAALLVSRSRRTGEALPMLGAGASIGAVTLIRPLEGMIVAVLLGAWSLGARGRRLRFAPTAALVVATAVTTALNLPYNAILTGSSRTFPVMAYFNTYYAPGVNDLGFGPNRGLGWEGLDPFPGHGWRDVVVNNLLNAFQVNVELFGWATGSILIVVFGVAFRPRELTWNDRAQVAVIAAVVSAQSLYYFSGGPDFGARYWHLASVSAVVLAARVLLRLGTSLTEVPDSSLAPRASPLAVPGVAIGLSMIAMLLFVPWRGMGKYDAYRGMQPTARALAADPRLAQALVLVRGRRHPEYASAAVYNPVVTDPEEAPGPLFVWDRSPEVTRRVLAAFPRRPVWILDQASRPAGTSGKVHGPLSAADVLRLADSTASR